MENVAFIGGYDKADMILYIGRLLTLMGKKVLIIDSTGLQKTRYVVPTMQAAKQYVTTYEKVDIAIGFQTLDEIKKYKALETKDAFDYDYALIDIDSYRGYYYFGIKTEDKKYFVTSFDIYNLRKGLQVFRRLETPTIVKKVLFSKTMDPAEDEYLNYLSKSIKIKWDSDIVYFPFENGDLSSIFANQRTGKIRVRGLSNQYIEGICYLTEEISGSSQGEVKKALRYLEKI